MPVTPKSKLPRLAREWYTGNAMVLWTHGIEDRATGWLSPLFHNHFRETLVHACARYHVACPAYVLMPDHWHMVWLGLGPSSDQLAGTRFLRRHLQPHLGKERLQDRAHDHVLREGERNRDRIVSACHYVRENPVRAGIAHSQEAWLYAGAMISGYPSLDPRQPDFWDRFWRIHARLIGAAGADVAGTQID